LLEAIAAVKAAVVEAVRPATHRPMPVVAADLVVAPEAAAAEETVYEDI
jgi:hypothetical protein